MFAEEHNERRTKKKNSDFGIHLNGLICEYLSNIRLGK